MFFLSLSPPAPAPALEFFLKLRSINLGYLLTEKVSE
jgi:hypothetical protein